ncbi:hypothetical protein JCM10449v2_006231 [Rhodotorula kratochvilovae]
MAARAGDARASFISANPPSPPRSAFLDTQGHGQTHQERQRSSSVGKPQPQRSNARIALGLLPNPRRRSSGGTSFVQGGAATQSKTALPVFGRKDSARAGSRAISPSAPSPIPPQLRALDSYNARNVAAALDQGGDLRQIDDVWQQVCVRVLPLFNGEGIRGFVEDLNALVLNHVQRRFALSQSARQRAQPTPSVDASSLVTGLVTADLTDLIRMGLTTLGHKLAPPAPAPALGNERLLARLNEIWLFFFTGILPHLEAVFWVLRSDDRLRAAVGRAPCTAQERDEGRIDVRRIALIEFRDEILHPEMERLVPLFSHVYHGGLPANEPDSRPGSRRPSFSAEHPPPPPDIRRARSHPHPPSRGMSPARDSPLPGQPSHPHPHPQRQYSSPPRISPDPNYLSSFSSPAPTSSATLPLLPLPLLVPPTPGTPSPAAAQAFARRRQMVAVLAALRTDDDRQSEMDALLGLIRPAPATARAQPQPPPAETGYSTPGVVSSSSGGEDASAPASGAATALSGSPVPMTLTDEPSSLSSRGGLAAAADTDDGDLAPLAPLAAPLLPRAIDARQRHRSRTMDSLDEEGVHPPAPAVPPPPALAPPSRQPPPLSRASSDGASLAEVHPGAGKSKPPPARRRSLFLPHFKRSNSAASTATAASAGSSAVLENGGASEDDAAGGGGGGGGGGGERLRRGLLRRNSSQKATELVGAGGALGLGMGVGLGGAGPALGAAGGFAVEDDALDE